MKPTGLPNPRTRQSLWTVKQDQPHLFAGKGGPSRETSGPPGFQACDREGFLHNPQRGLFLEEATGKQTWYDATSGEYRDFREGETLSLKFCGGAAVRQGKVDSGTSSKPQAPKHVVIQDLHRVAAALKTDLSHFDRPSAMVAVYGAGPSPGSVSVDIAARVVHEKLIRRLAAYRSEWSDEALQGALIGALYDLLSPSTSGSSSVVALPAISLAVVLGSRLVLAASPGAFFLSVGSPKPSRGAAPEPGSAPKSLCLSEIEAAAGLVLLVGKVGLGEEDQVQDAASRLQGGRPRAASIALLRALHKKGVEGPLAAAFVRLSPDTGPQEPAAKRQKTDGPLDKVRVRQILLRAWRGSGPTPTDPVRRKQVKRTPEDAEAEMSDVIDKLIADNCASFSACCKATSECQSAFKGGELIGDLGWIDREPAEQPKAKTPSHVSPGAVQPKSTTQSNPAAAIKSEVPAPVRRAAFELDISEMSDLITSELGVHILLRTA
eukprot:TRINITY_DN41642_c0_g1_i1.p1 TRINITY_DN41642_c0_g1~~TRINITY_DN41642_c0_g1_i1.p1  ORF type:complete len:505 (+),score=83.13 TRINITY_DN41642_c0_g1_i1:40-1515(+)